MEKDSSVKVLNCKFCFSFLQHESQAEKHLINFHTDYYQRLGKDVDRDTPQEEGLRGISTSVLSVAFSTLKFMQPFVKLEKQSLPAITNQNASTVQRKRLKLKNQNRKANNRFENLSSASISSKESSSGGGRKCKLQAQSKIKRQILEESDNEGLPSKRGKGEIFKKNQNPKLNTVSQQDGYPHCPLCRKTYKFSAFGNHLRKHRNAEAEEEKTDNKFKCKLCLQVFKTGQALRVHCLNLHPNQPSTYSCLLCDSQQDSIAYLIFHYRINHPGLFDAANERSHKNTKSVKKKSSTPDLKCEKCQKELSSKYAYDKHLKFHIRLVEQAKCHPYQCKLCERSFTLPGSLKRHLRIHNPKYRKICKFPECNKIFDTPYKLRRHEQLHYSDCRYQCPHCPANYTTNDRLNYHLRICHSSNGKMLDNIKRRNIRVSRASGGLLKQSEKLNFNQNPSSVIIKVETQSMDDGEEAISRRTMSLPSIDLVDRVVVNEKGESIHIKGEQLDDTGITEQRQNRENLYRSDMDSDNDNLGDEKESSFKCDECDTSYSRSYLLRVHNMTFHDRIAHDDSLIRARANVNVERDDNVSRHHGQVTLLCGTCGYLAKSAEDLEIHITTAPKHGKRFGCHICGSRFNVLKKLETHQQLMHFADKKYKCDKCDKDKRFATKAALSVHLQRIHLGSDERKRKVKCKICSQIYSKQYMKIHVRNAHSANKSKVKGKSNYEAAFQPQCSLCNDKFSTMSSLRRHIQLVHLGKPVPKWVNGKKKYSSGVIRNKFHDQDVTSNEAGSGNDTSAGAEKQKDQTDESLEIFGL